MMFKLSLSQLSISFVRSLIPTGGAGIPDELNDERWDIDRWENDGGRST